MALGVRELALLLCCAAMALLALQQEGDLHIEPAWFQPIERQMHANTRGEGHEIMHTYANGIAPLESELVSGTQRQRTQLSSAAELSQTAQMAAGGGVTLHARDQFHTHSAQQTLSLCAPLCWPLRSQAAASRHRYRWRWRQRSVKERSQLN